jgi:hypothetical protein
MRSLPFLLVALGATACIRTSTNPATGKVDVDVTSPFQKGAVWNGTVSSVASSATFTGTVKAVALNNQTTVQVSLDNAPPGMVVPWTLHEDVCGSAGPMVGDASNYPPITIGGNGHGEGSGTAPGNLNQAKRYHVNFHASQSDMATIVACADLKS